KLERQLSAAAMGGLVHTGAIAVGARGSAPVPQEWRPPLLTALVENNFLVSSSVIVRRSLLEEYGAFDPDPALFGSPDYELWLRLAPLTEFVHVRDPLV